MISLDGLKCLAACWAQPAALAEKVGVAPEKLASYVAGKKTMPPGVRDRLASAMGMYLRESPHRPGIFFFWTNLGYVLLATESRKLTESAYNLLAPGGCDFSVEVVPASGRASRRYRYLVFKPEGESRNCLMVFDRNGAVYTMLDEKEAPLGSSSRCAVPNAAYAAVDSVARAVLDGQRGPISATEELARWHIDFRVAERKARADDPNESPFP
jgi:hypothetical protein